jgi:hypothetical protein
MTSKTRKRVGGTARPRRDQPGDIVADLATVLLRRIGGITDRLVDRVLATEPGYEGIVPLDDMRRSLHDNIKNILADLVGKPRGSEHWDPPMQTGRRRAEQGLPLETLLHALRIVGQLVWEDLVAEARKRGRSETDSLVDGATRVWQLIDEFAKVVADSYRATEAQLARGDDLRRQALIDALLEGHGAEPIGAREASEVLDLPMDGEYAVVVAEIRPGDPSGLVGSDRIATGAVRSAWRFRADRAIGIVLLGSDDLHSLAQRLEPVIHGRAAAGPRVQGFAELASAFRLAELTLSTVPVGTSEFALFDDRLVPALVVSSPSIARRVAQLSLGALLDLDEPDRALYLETLTAYIECEGSATRAGSRLYCHRNTVLNRLRRIEKLTSRSLQNPLDVVEVALGLQAVRLLD